MSTHFLNFVPVWLVMTLSLLARTGTDAAEVLPPAPKQHFNDYAGVISPQSEVRLNETLANFERQTSSRILVAIFPRMESQSSIEDYTFRIAEAWKPGVKGKDNGAVLFVFVQDRKMFMQVGYGLEGALPDGLVKLIIENQIKPRFQAGHYDRGLTAGVNAILAAAQGEYRGGTATEGTRARRLPSIWPFLILFIVFVVLARLTRGGYGGTVYRRRGYTHWGSWSGGGWGGSSGGFGGGGLSGGGGRFGGGGAGGSW